MRIVVCTNRDLPGNLNLNMLLPRLSGHSVDIVLADKKRQVDSDVAELAEIKFLERSLAIDTLFPMIDAGPVVADGRLLTFEGLARVHGARVVTVGDEEEWNGGAPVAALGPDVVISARFAFIFKAPVIERVPHMFNLHPGALPAYSGQFPVLWALLNGDETIGCTLHRITAGIDKGPVIGIRRLSVQPGRCHFRHRRLAYGLGLDLAAEVVNRLAAGDTVDAEPQDLSRRRYHGWPDSAAFGRLRARGFDIIDRDEYLRVLRAYRSDLFPISDATDLSDRLIGSVSATRPRSVAR